MSALPAVLARRLEDLEAHQPCPAFTYAPDLFIVETAADDATLRRLAEGAAQALGDASAGAHAHPAHLFHVSRRYPPPLLEARIAALDEMLAWYASGSHARRDETERLVKARFPMAPLPPVVEALTAYLPRLDACDLCEGAENLNYLIGDKSVIKITKERHHHDFYSVIKLMRHMHVLYLMVDGYRSDDGLLEVEVGGNEMFVFQSERGLCRLIVQPFEASAAIGDLPPDVKAGPAFRRVWGHFIGRMEAMRRCYDVVLDLTDSRAGMRPARGNVMNTTNVVTEQDAAGRMRFKIIDPDVFDTDGSHKFSPREYLRGRVRRRLGLFTALRMALKIWLINRARESFVLRWQDRWMRAHARR